MKKIILVSLLLILSISFSSLISAQSTRIPEPNHKIFRRCTAPGSTNDTYWYCGMSASNYTCIANTNSTCGENSK